MKLGDAAKVQKALPVTPPCKAVNYAVPRAAAIG